ncbi:MAG: arginine repressor [Syntrophomonadaceae bacterium]|mgnify:CR=1 FL=1|jgi:transcriptional regulator of arginine metabolism|nr:arginine repressor [Syntrophomonadaceae bacterium]
MKARRHMAIRDIVSNQKISTQEELCEALSAQGFMVTQATVSRDIKELKLIKVFSPEGYHYALPEAPPPRSSLDRMRRLFLDTVVEITDSENLVVVKTIPGSAHLVASNIDTAEIPEIVGTVAGDDTIIVVVKPANAVPEVMKRFRSLLK